MKDTNGSLFDRNSIVSAAKNVPLRHRRKKRETPDLTLYSYHHLPEHLRDNEFIKGYYRLDLSIKQTLKSLFNLHNETWNVWTHLMGFLLFLSLTMYVASAPPTPLSFTALQVDALWRSVRHNFHVSLPHHLQELPHLLNERVLHLGHHPNKHAGLEPSESTLLDSRVLETRPQLPMHDDDAAGIINGNNVLTKDALNTGAPVAVVLHALQGKAEQERSRHRDAYGSVPTASGSHRGGDNGRDDGGHGDAWTIESINNAEGEDVGDADAAQARRQREEGLMLLRRTPPHTSQTPERQLGKVDTSSSSDTSTPSPTPSLGESATATAAAAVASVVSPSSSTTLERTEGGAPGVSGPSATARLLLEKARHVEEALNAALEGLIHSVRDPLREGSQIHSVSEGLHYLLEEGSDFGHRVHSGAVSLVQQQQQWREHVVRALADALTREASPLQWPAARWPMYVFMAGVMTCLLTSSVCHLFGCCARHVNFVIWRFDYAGIATLIVTSFYPVVWYGFLCRPEVRLFYLASTTAMGVLTIFVTLSAIFQTPRWRYFRAGLFVCLGLWGAVPLLHSGLLLNAGAPAVRSAMRADLAMGACYLVGALIYAVRIPERWLPGRFDIYFHSHQIFHVLIVVAAYLHFGAARQMLAWRDATGGCLSSVPVGSPGADPAVRGAPFP